MEKNYIGKMIEMIEKVDVTKANQKLKEEIIELKTVKTKLSEVIDLLICEDNKRSLLEKIKQFKI